MSTAITQSLEGNVLHAFTLANEFLKVCPEEIWEKQFGGWPIWRQFFHCFTAVDFFLRPEGAAVKPPPFGEGMGDLSVRETSVAAPAREQMRDYMNAMLERTRGYIAGLDDTALARKNEELSTRFGRDVTHASTLVLIAAHTMYHLGSCDAALRESGRPGVF